MLHSLAKKDLINHEKYEYVDLSPQGLKKAKEAQRKHTILFNFLKNVLKVNPRQADIDACGMEHAISPVTLKKLVNFIGFIDFCPLVGPDWLEYFKSYCRDGSSKAECEKHIEDSLKSYPYRLASLKGGLKTEVDHESATT